MILLDTPKLGFGLMRLPAVPGDPDAIDIEQTKKMVDLFMEAGLTYFDTAFVYGKDGASEKAAKEALVDRYPRDSFTLATKLNANAPFMASNEEECKRQFRISLERTGAGYFDFYLLHALQVNNYKKYDEYGLWDYVKGLKEEELIKHYGFSFHATPELLDKLLTEHPDVDFVQLQINYADWENPSVTSRANYEVARKHGVPIVVMEPVKGGTLANPPVSVQEILKTASPGASLPSWAIRYVASLPGILTVLSGMSNIEQMQDNLSYMKEFTPLSEQDQQVLHEAQRILGKSKTIPCTACRYCTEGCPKQIPIPDLFAAANLALGSGQLSESQKAYSQVPEGHRASDCIACRKCESVCPQHLPISENMKKLKDMFE